MNSRWKLIEDEPLPDGRAVFVYLAEARFGTRIAIRKSQRIMNGYMAVIDGLFDFDLDIPILAWREMDDLEEDLPLAITEEPE